MSKKNESNKVSVLWKNNTEAAVHLAGRGDVEKEGTIMSRRDLSSAGFIKVDEKATAKKAGK